MLTFRKEPTGVFLVYEGEREGIAWVIEKLRQDGSIKLAHTFSLSMDNHVLTEHENESIEFKIAEKVEKYYKFSKDVLFIKHNLYIHEDIPLSRKTFVAERNISVFSRLDAIADEEVYIGGAFDNAIPATDFESLLKNFPNSYELKQYSQARVHAVISNYIQTKQDYEKKYQKYMNKKKSIVGKNLLNYFSEVEYYKYIELSGKLKNMLADENQYNEKQWQKEILEIILLLYPKYIYVFDNVAIQDIYESHNRIIDFLLVDSTGNTDIIEIKQPFHECIVTSGTYRNNHVPLRELSGTVMQVEKYIFCLNKSGKNGENKLTNKFKEQLPDNFQIKITNPSGIIIMGRKNNLTKNQQQDFEIIKRKYKNIIDIITYDDLVDRLATLCHQWATLGKL